MSPLFEWRAQRSCVCTVYTEYITQITQHNTEWIVPVWPQCFCGRPVCVACLWLVTDGMTSSVSAPRLRNSGTPTLIEVQEDS